MYIYIYIYEKTPIFADLLSEFKVFLRPEASLGGLWGSSWHEIPILDDFGGQNGVPVEPPGTQGRPLSAFFSHWEVMIRDKTGRAITNHDFGCPGVENTLISDRVNVENI